MVPTWALWTCGGAGLMAAIAALCTAPVAVLAFVFGIAATVFAVGAALWRFFLS